jgi:hypothetical protein
MRTIGGPAADDGAVTIGIVHILDCGSIRIGETRTAAVIANNPAVGYSVESVAMFCIGGNDSRTDVNSSGLTTLLNPEFGLPNSYRTLAGGTCGTRTIEHDGTGGAELPFILDKTEGHATLIRDCLLAQPHRIRRAGIRILLGIGDCRQWCRDHHGDESNGAQFTHDVALQFGAWNDNDCSRSLFP